MGRRKSSSWIFGGKGESCLDSWAGSVVLLYLSDPPNFHMLFTGESYLTKLEHSLAQPKPFSFCVLECSISWVILKLSWVRLKTSQVLLKLSLVVLKLSQVVLKSSQVRLKVSRVRLKTSQVLLKLSRVVLKSSRVRLKVSWGILKSIQWSHC